jgi:hypothetical protein
MWDSVRRVGAGLIGAAVLLLALGRQAVVSQQPAPGPNPNIYVSPFAAGARGAGPGAVGQTAPAASAGRLGYGSLAPSGAPASGSLAASYANPSLGYGSLSNSNNNPYGAGGYGAAGYGMWGTQWMMNPYQGYLSGAADLTRANADYWQGIQQAKMTRQEAIRSSIQTRRAMIEEAEWERAHMPDPEKIRQAALERDLNIARHSPPLTDVWAARSLNSLLRHLINQMGQGAKGPNVPLNEETLDHINLTVGSNRGNVGLLKDSGNLHWPLALQRELFKDSREGLNSLMQTAYKSAAGGTKPDTATISDLRANYKKLKDRLDANVTQLTPDEYIEANRFLNYVDGAITALKSPSVGHFFDGSWKAKARNVAELVQFMRDQGLWFAPATPKDEAAYVSLYNSLAAFDRGIQRFAREGGSGSEGER